MENSSKEDYKIQSFDLETQKLLKTALKGHYVLSAAVLDGLFYCLDQMLWNYFKMPIFTCQTQVQLTWRKCPM